MSGLGTRSSPRPYTFYATAEAIARLGATPVFCDIDPDDFCIDPELIAERITGRTRAILPVHIFGHAANMPAIRAVAERHGLPVIEDAAQAFGGACDGVPVGALGDIATISFFPTKNLPGIGDGGMVVCRDEAVGARVRRLRFHGSADKVVFQEVGYNSRLDELQAAVIRVFLRHVDDWNDGRRATAEAYAAAGLGELMQLPSERAGVRHIYHLYMARHDDRDALIEGARRARCELGGLLRDPDAPAAGVRESGVPARRSTRRRGVRRAGARPADAPAHDPGERRRGRGGGRRGHWTGAGARVSQVLAEPSVVPEAVSEGPRALRIWVDMTNSPHVVIFRPLIARMIARGHEVTVTARDFAQTLGLLERYGMPHEVFGAHGGAGRAGKARAMASRTTALTRFARRERFDLAIGHGSTDQPPAAYAAGTPQVTMFDYEYAAAMHHWNGRFATRVLVPSAIPEWALWRYGIRAPKLVRYPGLKEEYYLADHVFDPGVMDELGLDMSRVIAVLRPPPEVTLYHRGLSSDVFSATLARLLDAAPDVQTVVLPRTDAQRAQLEGSVAIVPERPVDGPSLVVGGRPRRQRRRDHEP